MNHKTSTKPELRARQGYGKENSTAIQTTRDNKCMERKHRSYKGELNHNEHKTGMHGHMKPVEQPRKNSKICGRMTSGGLEGNFPWWT